MLGAILFFTAFAIVFIAFATLIIVSAIKEKKKEKDGQLIDLADFEYDSKEQVFRKKRRVRRGDDDPFDENSTTSMLNNGFNNFND